MAKQVNAIYTKYWIAFLLVERRTKDHFAVLNVSQGDNGYENWPKPNQRGTEKY